MIHTDGIQTIANAPVREASRPRRVPRVSDVRLTDHEWDEIRNIIAQAAYAYGLTETETTAVEALHRELDRHRRPVESS